MKLQEKDEAEPSYSVQGVFYQSIFWLSFTRGHYKSSGLNYKPTMEGASPCSGGWTSFAKHGWAFCEATARQTRRSDFTAAGLPLCKYSTLGLRKQTQRKTWLISLNVPPSSQHPERTNRSRQRNVFDQDKYDSFVLPSIEPFGLFIPVFWGILHVKIIKQPLNPSNCLSFRMLTGQLLLDSTHRSHPFVR